MGFGKNIFNTNYNVGFEGYEFDDFIIVTVPKVGTNFFKSLTKLCGGISYNFRMLNLKQVQFHNNEHLEYYDLDPYFIAHPSESTRSRPKKVYFMYRDPLNKFISALIQDYLRILLNSENLGNFLDGNDWKGNPIIDFILQTNITNTWSITALGDELIEKIKENPNVKLKFEEIDETVLSSYIDFVLRTLISTPNIFKTKHNSSYLHILFVLSLNYKHLSFINIDEVDVFEFFNKKYFNNQYDKSKEFLNYYESGNYIKNLVKKRMEFVQIFTPIDALLGYDYYFYNYLQKGTDESLFIRT